MPFAEHTASSSSSQQTDCGGKRQSARRAALSMPVRTVKSVRGGRGTNTPRASCIVKFLMPPARVASLRERPLAWRGAAARRHKAKSAPDFPTRYSPPTPSPLRLDMLFSSAGVAGGLGAWRGALPVCVPRGYGPPRPGFRRRHVWNSKHSRRDHHVRVCMCELARVRVYVRAFVRVWTRPT